MRDALGFTANAACTVLYTASMAVVIGAAASVYTQRLRDGLLVALGAFLFGCAGLAYGVWRTHFSRRRPTLRRA